MSIALFVSPDQHNFSRDFINVKFKCSDYLSQQGTKSFNQLKFSAFPGSGTAFTLVYGSTSITFESAISPDDSGLQFPANASSVVELLPYFKKNYFINSDFDVSFAGDDTIIFIAKTIGRGFDMGITVSISPDISVTNQAPGLPDIRKPNYNINFKLFLENPTHTGYEMIYESSLQLQSGSSGIASVPLGDKIHQKISSDIDRLGLEIPTDKPMTCTRTSRKFYFEFAEAFGEPMLIREINRSAFYNVIFGGQSYQGKNAKKLEGLIKASTAPFDRFLKQGAAIQFSREDQPQFLYFYNTRTTYVDARVIAIRTFRDGSSDTTTLFKLNLDEGKKIAFNVSYGNVYSVSNSMEQYEIYFTDNSGLRISEKQTYVIDRKLQHNLRLFLNYSSWGTLESKCFTGKSKPTFDISYEKAERILSDGYKLTDGQYRIFSKTLAEKFKTNTGFNDRSVIAANKDFFLSTLVFRYIDKKILPIEITSTEIELPGDNEFLFYQAFEYQYAFADDQYSETDATDEKDYPTSMLPAPIGPIIIYAGTPANPSLDIIQQQIP